MSMLANWSLEMLKREKQTLEDMKQRKRRPWSLPTNQVEQFKYQPLGQEKRESVSNLSYHRGLQYTRPVARIESGGCRTPQKWTFWTQKVDFFNLTPLNPPTNTPFLPTLWPRVDLLPDLGGVLHPPGYGPAVYFISDAISFFKKMLIILR